MAEKEATVFIVDVGATMGEKRNGRQETNLDWAMLYVWEKITSIISRDRKTLAAGVIGLRTDGTANELQHDPTFSHIKVFQSISPLLMPNLARLQEKIRVSKSQDGDAISALVIAIQLIAAYCKKNQWRRRIVLVTDGRGPMDDDGLDDIVRKMTQDKIQLIVLGVDFDDPEFGVKEENKHPIQETHEQLLKSLVTQCNGIYGTMAQAISELGTPRVKVVRPTPTFKGRLILGSPGSSDPIISINVERYARTSVARAKTASAFAVRPEAPIVDASAQSSVTMAAEELGNDVGDGSKTTAHLEAVKNSRIYQVDDESAPGGKRQVERDELATGYEYGRTAVFISDSDLNVTKLETEAGLQIIGFVERMKYERHMHMSPANLMIASKSNPQASLALSAFIHALFELDSYGIGRMVSKDGRDPDLVLLAPSIEADYECLLEVQIPFAEDIRPYRFPPLDRIMTVSGKVLTEHRNLPSAQLSQAMSDYVDQMDLSTFGKDDEGNPAEYMALEDTYSPVLHRIDQAVRWRAVYPSQPIPPAYEVLTRYSRAPLELEQSARPGLQKLIAAADLKKVPPKQKGRKKEREVVKPLSGLNVDELLGREKRSQISVDNAVPEFKQQLATAQDARAIEDAFKQMSVIITSLIKHSLGDSGYGRATEGLRVMREELTGLEEPRLYNDFIRDLKTKLLTDKLNGDRREMWWEIRRNRLGLIPKSESDVSDVAEDEAKLFFASR